jgi:hypothetical protein
MAKMNSRTIGAAPAALAFALGLLAGPAFAGLDFTAPQLPPEPQAGAPSISPSELNARDRAEHPGIQIAPGVSLSPDIEGPSPNGVIDPTTNPRRTMEPWLRLQVPIPP